MSRSTESQDYIHKALEEVYNKEIFKGVTLDSVSQIFRNTILLLVLAIIFGMSVLLFSEKPISKIGNDLVLVSISLLSIAAVPLFVVTDMPIVKLLFDYLSKGLYQQLISGIVLLAIGIVLIIIGKKKNK
jgi:predicted tellurium resistance membrane protein TerC